MSNPFAPPEPKTSLDRHRVLCPSASVRVSPLCLGTMSLGAGNPMTGSSTKETSFAILDEFFNAGGQFIDTANNYTDGESESFIGEWMKMRDVRDEIVLATKYSSPTFALEGKNQVHSNSAGNSAKSLHLSVETSLKRLQTSYIDILYIHHWDWQTSTAELMHTLNDLLRARKVLYLGASDLPAYVVARANEYARGNGLRGFVAYQGRFSAAHRDLERDVFHLAREEGMAIIPWGVSGSGLLKTDAMRNADEGRIPMSQSEHAVAITKVLESIATKRAGPPPVTSIALAYARQKAPYTFPVIGARKLDHVREYIKALDIVLSQEEVEAIDSAAPFDPGFPLSVFGSTPEGNFLVNSAHAYDYMPRPRPILQQ